MTAPVPVVVVAETSVELVDVAVWVLVKSDAEPSALALAESCCSAVWMPDSCVLVAVRPLDWFCRAVIGCWSIATSAWMIEFVSRPEARPVIWRGEDEPSDETLAPDENELVVIGCVDMWFALVC